MSDFTINIPAELKNRNVLLKVFDEDKSQKPHNIYYCYKVMTRNATIDIGNGKSVRYMVLINYLQKHCGLSAELPMIVTNVNGTVLQIQPDWRPNDYPKQSAWPFKWAKVECSITGRADGSCFYIRVHSPNSSHVISEIFSKLVDLWVPTVGSGLLYEWNNLYKRYEPSTAIAQKVLKTDLVALDSHFLTIENDVQALSSKAELAIKLGATSGYNYLLQGIPGTGKSSFVKAISHQLQLPLYIVKSSSLLNPDVISKVLCPPKVDGKDFAIVLIEDFDRFMDSSKGESVLSELLNALDGVYPAFGTFRFFSANHPEKVKKFDALGNRMRRTLTFNPLPAKDMQFFLNNLFSDNENISIFCDKVQDRNLSMRSINNYISRFVMEDDPIKSALDNIDSWFSEL